MDDPALGGLPSAPDYRDQVVAAAFAPLGGLPLPNEYQAELAPPMYQRQIPACVSHDVADLMKLWWFRQHGQWVDFSPRFLDILSAQPEIPLNGGRVPRTVLRVAARQGCATTATLPNDTTLSVAQYRDPAAVTDEARAEALKYRIPGYFNVRLDPTLTRQAIYRYGAVTTLFQVGEELWKPTWAEKDISPLRPPKLPVSGHQMGQKGFAGALNTVRNEWSDAWARKGEADFDWAAWRPHILEQWAIAQVPQDVADFLHDLPPQADFHYHWARDLRKGDISDDVKFAQVALMILGFMQPVTPRELGVFGPKTSAAVGAYQKARAISPQAPDSAGPRTRAALNKDFSI